MEPREEKWRRRKVAVMVYLEPEHMRWLESIAARYSRSAYIRRLIERDMQRAQGQREERG